jgi:hypothetical protein
MESHSSPLTNRPTPQRLPPVGRPPLPQVWSQLDPLRQHQLAQQLAELIRRQLVATPQEDTDHEQP